MDRKRHLRLGSTAICLAIVCSFAARSDADIFEPGPATPPADDGSATLTVDDDGRASFGTMLYQGTPLSTITQLSYDSYSSSALTLASPTLQFEVDYDSTDTDTTYQGRLVSEHSGPIVADAWGTNNPLAGRW